jgi:hypothetical protein
MRTVQLQQEQQQQLQNWLRQLSTAAAVPCSKDHRCEAHLAMHGHPRLNRHFKQLLSIALYVAVACVCHAAGCTQDACCYCGRWPGRAVNSSGAAGPGVSTAQGQRGQAGVECTHVSSVAGVGGRQECYQQMGSQPAVPIVTYQPGTASTRQGPDGEQCGPGLSAAVEQAAGQLSISVVRL